MMVMHSNEDALDTIKIVAIPTSSFVKDAVYTYS
jgi:hypothetical protein